METFPKPPSPTAKILNLIVAKRPSFTLGVERLLSEEAMKMLVSRMDGCPSTVGEIYIFQMRQHF